MRVVAFYGCAGDAFDKHCDGRHHMSQRDLDHLCTQVDIPPPQSEEIYHLFMVGCEALSREAFVLNLETLCPHTQCDMLVSVLRSQFRSKREGLNALASALAASYGVPTLDSAKHLSDRVWQAALNSMGIPLNAARLLLSLRPAGERSGDHPLKASMLDLRRALRTATRKGATAMVVDGFAPLKHQLLELKTELQGAAPEVESVCTSLNPVSDQPTEDSAEPVAVAAHVWQKDLGQAQTRKSGLLAHRLRRRMLKQQLEGEEEQKQAPRVDLEKVSVSEFIKLQATPQEVW